MVKAGKQDDEKRAADEAAALSSLADASAKLVAEHAAAMAVFTAYGIGVATQMAGMMLGALRGPAQAEEIGGEDNTTAADSGSNVVPLRAAVQAVEPEPVAKAPVPVKPATKPAARKAVSRARPTAAGSKAAAAKPAVSSTAGDDLKKISGIGPRLEKVLHDRGILHYGDIGRLSKAALGKLDTELGLEGRVLRDDWAGQAKALSGGKG